jgi:4-amino-4-deoxy-L-arabinose transferase-like glycosyltransferase
LDLAHDRLDLSQPAQSKNQLLRELAWPVITGCIVRLLIGLFFYKDFLNVGRDHWEFGYEMGHIARSIVSGHGFANPYWDNTGLTAILTPVYPCLLAGVFAAFGTFTKASALAMVCINCCLSSVTAVPIFFIARKTFDAGTARLASWVWVFFPYSIYFSVATLWYHAFVGLILAVIFLYALYLQNQDRLGAWLGFGALFGFAALTNPVVAGIAPAVGIWLMHRLAQQKERWISAGAAGLFAMMLMIFPWLMRNSILLHQQIPFKDGFWLEVCVGNVNTTLHWWDSSEHPSGSEQANMQFEHLGEFNYMAAKRSEALGYMKAHPGQYAWRSLRHAIFFWTGFWSVNREYLRMEPFDPENIVLATTLSTLALVGLRRLFRTGRGEGGAALFVLVLLVYPIPYYLSHVDPGYRHPLDPLLVVLASSAVLRRSRHRSISDHSFDEEIRLAFR